MLGNRGEDGRARSETLDFLAKAAPHEYDVLVPLGLSRTRDFHDAEKAGWLEREQYFTGDFQELETPSTRATRTSRG